MITKEELLQLMQQDNAIEVVYEMLFEQENRIHSLEEELGDIKARLSKI